MNPAKAYAHLFSPLGGEGEENYRGLAQVSFLRSPITELKASAIRKSGAKYAFLGVSFDEGVVGKPGTEEAPREFRLASQEYFPYWFEFEADLEGCAIDCGDIAPVKVNPKKARKEIYDGVRELLKGGVTPIICGGDRSISIQAARALSDHIGKKKKMGVLHLGAQLDMAQSWAGEKELSTCAMARITELSNVKPGNVAIVGVRNSMNPKDYFDLARKRKIAVYPMFDMIDRGIDACFQEAVDRVWNGTQAHYLSFNMNCMDASAAPGVTMTEPGGIESREIMRLVRMIGNKKKVSVIDITENCPLYDIGGTTSRLSVCVVLRLIAAIMAAKGQTVDPNIKRSDL